MRFQFRAQAGRDLPPEGMDAQTGSDKKKHCLRALWVGMAMFPTLVLTALVLWLVSHRRRVWLQLARYQGIRQDLESQPGKAKFAVWKEHKPQQKAPAREEMPDLSKVGADETSDGLSKTVITQPDDLAVIEGIGPETVVVLRATGIATFQQLSQTSVDRLKGILLQSGIRHSPPDTWPAQARLAAEGRWDKLKALQSQLQTGYRLMSKTGL